MAGDIYLSNLSGQFDYQQILQKYQELKFQQISLIQQKEERVLQQQAAFKTYADLLKSVRDGFEKVADLSLLDAKTVSVSDESVASVSITDGAKVAPANLEFTVTSLAANDVWLSQKGVENSDDGVTSGDGTLTITINGEDIDVDYTSSDSIKDIAAKINGATDKINASVFYDGNGYRLILSSKESGTDNAITLSDSGDLLDTLELGSDYADSHVQEAANAKIEIYGQSVESQSNTFSNVLDGIDITIHQSSETPVRVSIDDDPQTLKQNLEEFFSAYNSLVDYAKEVSGKDGPLSGDYTLHSIRSAIFQRLTPLMDRLLVRVDHTTGHISLDGARFEELFRTDKEALKTTIDDLKSQLDPYFDALFDIDGVVRQKQKSYQRVIDSYEESIRSTAQRVDKEIEILRKQFIHLDSLLAQLKDVQTRVSALLNPKQQQ